MTTTTTVTGERPLTADLAEPDRPPQRTRSAVNIARRLYGGLGQQTLIIAVLAGSFLARWLLADRNSYWLDELYSVAIYGIWNPSAGAAVERLANTSVHPPLYQAILYVWMDLFGDTERSSRSLSNLYITLATLFLYLLVRDMLSHRVALWSAVTFALMYSPMHFALETRSYAQTIFLATLSSYALVRLMRVGAERGWRRALFSPTAALLFGANVALLLTHYFNAFFYVAQGVIAGIFVLCALPRRRWLAGLGAVAVMYAVQGATFTLAWGHVLLGTYRKSAGSYSVEEEGLQTPWDLLKMTVTPNIDPPWPIWVIALLVVAVIVARAGRRLLGGRELTSDRQAAWTVLYLFGWLVLPLVVLVLAFLITGTARYSARYVLYAMPALAPLVVITIGEAARLVGAGWRRVRGRGVDAAALTDVALIIVIVTLVIPGTLRGVSWIPSDDYRGAAQRIVATIESDPGSSYVLYDTTFRDISVLDYYLARYSDAVRVDGIIRVGQERGDRGFAFESGRTEIEQHDFLIVAFIHHRITGFPNALRRLTERYPVHFRQIDEKGKGLIIFRIHPPSEGSP
jgi:4-amino-4-deoxy-L-arabinose transferase-like glycosyltransferase